MQDTVNWAYTPVNILRQCERKYFFYALMASWGRKLPVRRKAYELKKMQTLQMWVGSIVDKFMEICFIPAIVANLPLDFEVMAEDAVTIGKKQFEFSYYQKYQDAGVNMTENSAEACILDIHELGISYDDADILASYQTVREAVLKLPTIMMPDGQLLVEYLKEMKNHRANVMDWVVYIEKAKINPQMDLLGYYDYKPVVMDWKMSASYTSDYARQLLICGITVYLKRLTQPNKPPYALDDIRMFEVNLLRQSVKEHIFTQEEMNTMLDYINLTSEDIFLLVDNRKFEEIDITEFDETANQSSCNMCNFRPLCSYLLTHNNVFDEKSYLEYVSGQQYRRN